MHTLIIVQRKQKANWNTDNFIDFIFDMNISVPKQSI